MDLTAEQERDRLIFELIVRRLDNERQRTNELDSKAGNLIGFISVVVGLVLGAGTFKLSSLLLIPALSVLFFVGVGILLLSIGFALGGFRVRRWTDVPNVQHLLQNYISLPYDKVLQTNAVEMANAVTDAEIQNNQKARSINKSWYFLIAGLSLVFIFIVVFIASGVEMPTNE